MEERLRQPEFGSRNRSFDLPTVDAIPKQTYNNKNTHKSIETN